MKINEFTIGKSLIHGVTAVKAKSNFSFAKHWHDEYGIGVLDAGAQSSLSGRGVVEAVCGNTITVNPGEVHDGKPIGDQGRAWRMLYFDPALISSIVQDISQGTVQTFEITAPIIRDQAITQKFNLYYSCVNQPHSTAAQQEILYALVSDLLKLDNFADNTTLIPSQISQAIDFMNDEPTKDIQLSDLSSLTGLSRFQVLRGISSATGFTPHAYLIQKRLDLTKALIREGKSLCYAADLAGFNDQSHMHRVFVKKYGITPGKYAKAFK